MRKIENLGRLWGRCNTLSHNYVAQEASTFYNMLY